MDSPLAELSADDFDRLIMAQSERVNAQQTLVNQEIEKLNREKARLKWLTEGRDLMTDDDTEQRRVQSNGKPPSLQDAVLSVMEGRDEMRIPEIIEALI